MFHKQRGIQIEKICDKEKVNGSQFAKTFGPYWVLFYGLSLLFYFQMGDICIASLNVNGARDRVKRSMMYEIMGQKKKLMFYLYKKHIVM